MKPCLCILYYYFFPCQKAYKESLCQYSGYLNLNFSHFQVNTKFLAPLFLAYDDRLKEKEQLIRTYDVSFVALEVFIQLLHFLPWDSTGLQLWASEIILECSTVGFL